jgi:L-threonylcarbamoyladenylate synthase
MNLLKANPENIRRAAGIIKQGGLVSFPTETVYGLGADALNPIAVSRIFEVKDRPYFDPMIVHIADMAAVHELVTHFGEIAKKLAERFWPGPLTIVLKKSGRVPDIVTAGLDTVGLRMPANRVALDLIEIAGTPVAAPSANPFGYLSPTSAAHVSRQLGDRIDIILDGGICPVGVESTILKIDDIPRLLRPGGLPLEEIEEIVGKVEIGHELKRIDSPGQLPAHYAPRVPVRIVEDIYFEPEESSAALLAYKTPARELSFRYIEVLSPDGNLRDAAANLFSCLHRLDSAGVDIIYVEAVPETGLGRAIMDRLRKAVAGKSH